MKIETYPVKKVTAQDFNLDDFSLKNMKGKVVILWFSPSCGHCIRFHPNFNQAAKDCEGEVDVQFCEIDMSDAANMLDLDKIDDKILDKSEFNKANVKKVHISQILDKNCVKAKFKVNGWPTVVSFLDGKYFSSYGPSDKEYRSVDDVINYASTIGTSDIHMVSDNDI